MVSPLTLYVAEIEHAARLQRAERAWREGVWLSAEAPRRSWWAWGGWWRRLARPRRPVVPAPWPGEGRA
jgi:hypothetical protein